ncbi:GNAT family N-acetyltransferase [Pseudomonas sp. Irchel 3E20]|uniref:GNAT family N-acetyltransferase n=1 Tax=Pseudomonas sp. Irchel 3E20 TaxID=2008983 RepID=UPI000BA4DF39|nr:GNAT family N-acetyltransferase [Pseudomonas sp. Irchel 3E20]
MYLFETPRLLGRQLTREDLPALGAMLSDPEVMRFSVGGVCDEHATRRFFNACLDCYAAHGMGPWALVDKASKAFVGFCGVSPEQVGDVQELNLGYRLARRFWNQGLATEAVKGVLAHVFSRRQLASVVVIIEPAHSASLKVAQKAGFKDFQVLDFHDRPVRLYRMNRSEANLADLT